MFKDVFEGAKSPSIIKVMEHYTGVSLPFVSRSRNINCPLHKDDKPSCNINLERNTFKCYSCGVSGSPIDFVMKYIGYADPVDAAKDICESFGIQYMDRQFSKDVEYENHVKVHTYLSKLFVECNKLDNALDYWKSRGFNQKLIDDYGLGYCPTVFKDSNNTIISLKDILKKQFPDISESTLNSYGLYDFHGQCVFSERYMFAIKNAKGDVVAFSGRTATNSPAKYKNSITTKYFEKEKVLYNYHKAKAFPSVYVVEGQADALSLIAAGVPNVVASLGTAFTSKHLELLKGKDVILALDNDDAGHKTMISLVEANPHSLYVQDIFNGMFKDFNEALQYNFDIKYFLARNRRMLGVEYYLKLIGFNAIKLNHLKSDKYKAEDGTLKEKSFDQIIKDTEEYDRLLKLPCYLDLSSLEDRRTFYNKVCAMAKGADPVVRHYCSKRLRKLLKGEETNEL